MAIEESIKINIDADGGAKSLSELKKEFKETQKTLEGLTQGSKEYVATLQKLGGIKDDIGDLNTTIKAFNPEGKIQAVGTAIGGVASGFQAAQGAAALFGQEGEALQKTLLKVQAASALADGIKGVVGMGDAFKVLGAIVKANPIFLIIGVITAIIGVLATLREKVGFIGDAFDAVGDVISYVIDKGKEFLDWIGVTTFALDDMRQSIQKNNELIRESMSSRYDTEIRLAKAAGKNTMELELAKQKAIKDTTQAQIDSLKRKEELSEDEKKQLAELKKLNLEAVLTTVEIYGQARVAREKSDEEATKKYNEELKKRTDAFKQAQLEADKVNAEADEYDRKRAEEKLAREKKHLQDLEDARFAASEKEYQNIIASQTARNELIALQNTHSFEGQIENLNTQRDLELANTELTENEKLLIKQKYAEETTKLKQDQFSQELQATQQLMSGVQAISDLVFAHQLSQANGNAKKEREIKKKQFKVNKAFGIVNATIDGVQAVQKALNNPYPLNIVLAVASGLLAAANIAKIASSKFDDGGGGGSGGGSIGSLGSAGGGVALSPPSTGSTQLNPDGSVKNANLNNQPVKAVVVETDITKTQKRVNTIEERAKL